MDEKTDQFKTSFKYYKSKNPSPDLSTVVDFSNCKQAVTVQAKTPDLPAIHGITSPESWKVYELPKLPGFYFIRNPFSSAAQKYWVYRCIQEFPSKPHICNLDAHMSRKDTDNIWELSQQKSDKNPKFHEKSLMDRLRWVTLGYHHNWDTKVYSRDGHTPFPVDLAYLSRYMISAVGLRDNYNAEAAIVNYYHLDSTLAGHTDHSEFDLEAPLVSVSFGQTAVFLVGGTTKSTEPVPMFLRSGDVTIMSGKSRLAYHAIPKIFKEPNLELPCCINENIESSASKVSQGSTSIESPGTSVRSDENLEKDEASEPSKKVQKVEGMTMLTKSISTCECDSSEGSGRFTKNKNDCAQTVPVELPESRDSLEKCVQMINDSIRDKLNSVDFKPYSDYLKKSRINMNVRQVFKHGQTAEDAFCDNEGSAEASSSAGDFAQ